LIDVGEGRRNNGGAFADSNIQSRLHSNTLNVPSFALVDERELPFLVSDEAYPLAPYLMQPYPRRSDFDLRKKDIQLSSQQSKNQRHFNSKVENFS